MDNCKLVKLFWQEYGIKVRFVTSCGKFLNDQGLERYSCRMYQMWHKNITWHIFDTSLNLSYRKTGQWASGTKDYNSSTFITYVDNIDLEYYNFNILYYVYYVSMVCPNVKLEIILIWLCHSYLIWKTITFYELLLSRKTIQFTESSSFM
jgi:DNA-directed RNA polymerase subunit N (RpoN/RPB10)